jgi:hypothetical protein
MQHWLGDEGCILNFYEQTATGKTKKKVDVKEWYLEWKQTGLVQNCTHLRVELFYLTTIICYFLSALSYKSIL